MVRIQNDGDVLRYHHRAQWHLMLVLVMRGWAAIGLLVLVPVLLAVNAHQGFSGFAPSGSLDCVRATATCTVNRGTGRERSVALSALAEARVVANPARPSETRLVVGDPQGGETALSLYQWDAQSQAKLEEVSGQMRAFVASGEPSLHAVFPEGTGPKPIAYVLIPAIAALLVIKCFRSFTSVDVVIDRSAGTVTLRRRRLGIPTTTVLQLANVEAIRTDGHGACARARAPTYMAPLALVMMLYFGGPSVQTAVLMTSGERWKVFEGFASPAIGEEATRSAREIAAFLGVEVQGAPHRR